MSSEVLLFSHNNHIQYKNKINKTVPITENINWVLPSNKFTIFIPYQTYLNFLKNITQNILGTIVTSKKVFVNIWICTMVCNWEWSRPRLCSRFPLFNMSWQMLKVVLCCFFSQVPIDMALGFQMSHFSLSELKGL